MATQVMRQSIAGLAAAAPLKKFETVRPRMAKALNAVEDSLTRERRRVGAALRRAAAIVGLDDKEVCALLGTPEKPLDKGQYSRWLSGDENINLARVYGTKLHGPFALEQARDADGCVVETTVTYRAVTR